MIIESSSPRAQGDVAKLQSQFIQVTPNPRCFKFWYHMKGSSMGRIDIDIQTESSVVPVWTLSGDQGSDWNHGSFEIPNLPGKKYKVCRFHTIVVKAFDPGALHSVLTSRGRTKVTLLD